MPFDTQYAILVIDIDENIASGYRREKREAIRECRRLLLSGGEGTKGTVKAKDQLIFQAHTTRKGNHLVVVQEEL